MKKFFKILTTSLVAVMLVCMALVPAFGAVNGKDAAVGSTVEYTLYISDAVQSITGIHLEFFYDQDVLELKDVNLDNLPNSTLNDNINKDGSVKVVNALINGSQGLKCAEKTELAKLTFEVISEGDCEIKYYIPYMYDFDVVNLYQYTLSQSIVVNGDTVVDDVPPVLADETDFEKIESFDKGDFANNVEGTGSGEKPQDATVAPQNNGGNENNGGNNKGNGNNANKNNSTTTTGAKDNNNSTVIIACVCVGAIVGAIVVLVVAKSKATKPEKEAENQD